MGASFLHGDCLKIMPKLCENSIDAVVTDPPYGLEFMGRSWDHGVPGVPFWKEALRVLKPGGHMLAFGGTRTFHRQACAIEDAGFEIRDCVMWVYGSGFPKSLDVGKAIDKDAGAERVVVGVSPNWRESKRDRESSGSMEVRGENAGLEYGPAITDNAKKWDGWGTALKPAWEPIILARKPLIGTVVQNVLEHGTGALNISGCRVGEEALEYRTTSYREAASGEFSGQQQANSTTGHKQVQGRFPANLIHDGGEEVLACFPEAPGQCGPSVEDGAPMENNVYGAMRRGGPYHHPRQEDSKSAARFFYCAKASKADREEGLEEMEAKAHGYSNQALADMKRGIDDAARSSGVVNSVKMRKNTHPTVKPTDLMRYLCRLITPPSGKILDPFMGSGSTGKAAVLEGFDFIGIEQDEHYVEIAQARVAWAEKEVKCHPKT